MRLSNVSCVEIFLLRRCTCAGNMLRIDARLEKPESSYINVCDTRYADQVADYRQRILRKHAGSPCCLRYTVIAACPASPSGVLRVSLSVAEP